MTEVREAVYVTGRVNIDTPEKTEQVLAAFKQVCKSGLTTIYVLGSLFNPDLDPDAAYRMMGELPGRKVLVYDDDTPQWERDMKYWYSTADHVEIELWGRKFWLTSHLTGAEPADELVICSINEPGCPDNETTVNASWDEWNGQYGPGGLQHLYALSVYADGLRTGFAIP